MVACEASGQSLLVFEEPVCPRCPYGVRGRCRGPTTAGSVLDCGTSRIGCTSTERQIRFYVNFSQNAPERISHPPPIPELPPFLPCLEAGLPTLKTFPADDLYAISLGKLLRPNGTLAYDSPEDVRRALHLPAQARLCLVGTCQEDLLESAWRASITNDLWRKLSRLRFDLATTLSFAVWPNQPRFDQIYAQERNLGTYDLLTGFGIPTVPIFFCAAEEDYRAAVGWLEERPLVQVVGILAQFYRDKPSFSRFFKDVCRFRDIVPRKLHFLVIGCGTAEKIRMVFDHLDSATVLTTKPVSLGRSGHAVAPSLDHFRAKHSLGLDELVASNVLQYRLYCESLCGIAA